MITHYLRSIALALRRLAVGWLAAAILLSTLPAAAQTSAGPIYSVEVGGIVSQVTVGLLQRALRLAETSNATALIITLSSQGGVLRDVRPFARAIADARVPVVVFVAPAGTAAGTTGTLLLSAAHLSALAPGTSFGSATPLAQVDATLSEQTRQLVIASVADQLYDWNADRGRNTDWIDQAVREGAILNNQQAIALNPPAINLVATDLTQLLTLLDGRVVRLADGRELLLNTLGRSVIPVAPTFWEQLRLALADPTVAFVLLVLGALAIYLEFAAPGTTLFAGVGVVLLAGATLGLIVLPLNLLALLVVLAGLVLIGLEFVVPAHGGLTIGGLALLVGGALNLIDANQAPGVGVSPWAIGSVAVGAAAVASAGLWLALSSRRRPVRAGREALVGQVAEVRQTLDPEGLVFVEGALWRAVSEDGDIVPGEWVQIVAMHQLRLLVRRVGNKE